MNKQNDVREDDVIMTPKEKAIELCLKFSTDGCIMEDEKRCALITVDEMLLFIDEQMQGWLDADWVIYWEQVKKEIKKM